MGGGGHLDTFEFLLTFYFISYKIFLMCDLAILKNIPSSECQNIV